MNLNVLYTEVFMDKVGVDRDNKQMEPGALELNLGGIELTVDQITRLRPGTSIEFQMPKATEAILRLNGRDWALVAVQFAGDRMNLEVQELRFKPALRAESNLSEVSEAVPGNF